VIEKRLVLKQDADETTEALEKMLDEKECLILALRQKLVSLSDDCRDSDLASFEKEKALQVLKENMAEVSDFFVWVRQHSMLSEGLGIHVDEMANTISDSISATKRVFSSMVGMGKTKSSSAVRSEDHSRAQDKLSASNDGKFGLSKWQKVTEIVSLLSPQAKEIAKLHSDMLKKVYHAFPTIFALTLVYITFFSTLVATTSRRASGGAYGSLEFVGAARARAAYI